MKKVTLVCVAPSGLCAAVAKFAPTSDYTVREIEGWKVLVNNELLNGHSELAGQTFKLLGFQL